MVGDNRLARFQAHATASILRRLRLPSWPRESSPPVQVPARRWPSTFPALLDIAATAGLPRTGPHTLALYPRNELLRDQAREALRAVTELGPLDGAPASRPARIGLLYGKPLVPVTCDASRDWRAWKRRGQGWASPYFPCVTEDCQGSLVWSDADRAAGRERLVCSACGFATAVRHGRAYPRVDGEESARHSLQLH